MSYCLLYASETFNFLFKWYFPKWYLPHFSRVLHKPSEKYHFYFSLKFDVRSNIFTEQSQISNLILYSNSKKKVSFANFAQEPIPLAFKALKFHYPTFLSPNLKILFRNFSQMTLFIGLNYQKRALLTLFLANF